MVVALLVPATAPASAGERYQPEPGDTWQIQLTGRIDTSVNASMFDVDVFDVSAATVSRLHDKGAHVVCYMSAGSSEDWRPDDDKFPARVRGKELQGWPGEHWLDVRQLDVLKPIMRARLDRCRRKGFDGVDFDNVDGYRNDTGFPLTAEHQLRYNRWLARAAHRRGLAAGLKNDLGQVRALEPFFDFAVNEQCFQYDECDRLEPFIAAGKAVFDIEYDLERSEFCPQSRRLSFSSLRKRLSLGPWRAACRR